MKPIGDIRFANPNQTVGVTRYRVIAPCNTTNGGTVEFYGTGVPDLVRRMQAADQTSIPAVLQNTGSRTLTTTLSDIKQNPSDPTRATGKLTLASKPPPGKYTGTLALSQDVVNAPKTTVEVDSRAWFLWAIVFILLGVVTSAAVTNWLALRRRKALLNRELEDIVKNYRDYRDLNYPEDPERRDGAATHLGLQRHLPARGQPGLGVLRRPQIDEQHLHRHPLGAQRRRPRRGAGGSRHCPQTRRDVGQYG